MRYLNALRRADRGDAGSLAEIIARAVTDSIYRFLLPGLAGPHRLVPLRSLADSVLSGNALAVAAKRGRLRAVRRTDQWYSTKHWVEQYKGEPLQAILTERKAEKVEQVNGGSARLCDHASSRVAEGAFVSGWGVIPTIRVRDMAEALAFYLGPLEFALDRGGEGESNSAVSRGDARLMLETAAGHYGDEYNAAIRQRLGSAAAGSLYIEAADLAGFHSRLQAAGARIIDPLADRPWGQTEFTVEDHEGNWLSFWEATGTA